MRRGDRDEAYKFLYAVKLNLSAIRKPESRFDYGDAGTHMLHTMRIGTTVLSPLEDSYGFFLGKHEDKYVIGIKLPFGMGLAGCEVFDTLEEMHSMWELD